MNLNRQPLPLSVHRPMPGAFVVAPVGNAERFRVNVYLRRRPDGPPWPNPFEIGAQPPRQRQSITREEFEERYGASPADVAQVSDFAKEQGLSVLATSLPHRTVTIEGAAANFAIAFATTFSHFAYAGGGGTYRAHEGPLHVPPHLTDIVVGVVGFDERLAAKPSVARHPGVWSLQQLVQAQIAAVAAAQVHAAPRAQLNGRLLAAARTTEAPTERLQDLIAEAESIIRESQRAATFAALDALDIKTPPGVAQLYNFPVDVDGSGQCIGIIEMGGGYRRADIEAYFAFLGLPMPNLRDVSISGSLNAPGVTEAYDLEVCLDIEIAGGAAPGANLVCYFAPVTALGFIESIQTAIHDRVNRPSAISVSWDLSEAYWLLTPSTMAVFDDILSEAPILGVTICCSSGDYGAASEYHDGRAWVDYPASHPCVMSCGGTTLVSRGDITIAEVAWNTLLQYGQATGGGVSQRFPLPDWQDAAGVPPSVNPGQDRGRGCPDVAGNADPRTGYIVQVDGKTTLVCGTSSVAPLYAALIARINQSLGIQVGYINPFLYRHVGGTDGFRDIVIGDNGAYFAGQGWDACTGWGSPDGTRLRDRLGVQTE
jgi:kumamolisin